MAADGVILDLEDAVPPAQKAQAREWVVAALRRVDFGPRECIVRVNAAGAPEHDADLAAVVPAGPDALLLPKLSDAAEVERLDAEVEPPRAVERASPGQPSASTSWSRPSRPSSASRRWPGPSRARRPSSTGRGTWRARRARGSCPAG